MKILFKSQLVDIMANELGLRSEARTIQYLRHYNYGILFECHEYEVHELNQVETWLQESTNTKIKVFGGEWWNGSFHESERGWAPLILLARRPHHLKAAILILTTKILPSSYRRIKSRCNNHRANERVIEGCESLYLKHLVRQGD